MPIPNTFVFCLQNLMMQEGHFVYMLRCRGNRIYTGYAKNVIARYQLHCQGKGARFTNAFRPDHILRIFQCIDKSSALRLEHCIKQLPKSAKEQLAITSFLPYFQAQS
jgi:putative endonuclease